jgi:hypothetical protein
LSGIYFCLINSTRVIFLENKLTKNVLPFISQNIVAKEFM